MTQPSLLDLPAPEPTPNPVKTERQRLIASARRVLARLQETPGEWVSNAELSRPDIGGLGGVRRKWELEREGHVIEKRLVAGGRYEYRWMGLKGMVPVSGGDRG